MISTWDEDSSQAASSAAPSDHSLLRRFRGGDQDAATQLYLRYANRLRALIQTHCSAELARRVEVEDIVQSVFGSFFRGANRGYYDVPAGEELWGLFLVIALNKVRSKGAFHRAAKRDVRATVGGDWLEQGGRGVPEDDAAACVFLRLVIDETLQRFPAPQKDMIVLRIEGHDVADIARQTDRSKRTVERVLQGFREQLGALLEGA